MSSEVNKLPVLVTGTIGGITGDVNTVEQACDTATLSNVASSASNVTLLSANLARRSATIFNDSTQICYVKFGTTASSSSYTVQIPSNSYYEFPQPCYTGQVDALWASANGNARISEMT